MQLDRRPLKLGLLAVVVAALAACDGGGSDGLATLVAAEYGGLIYTSFPTSTRLGTAGSIRAGLYERHRAGVLGQWRVQRHQP